MTKINENRHLAEHLRQSIIDELHQRVIDVKYEIHAQDYEIPFFITIRRAEDL